MTRKGEIVSASMLLILLLAYPAAAQSETLMSATIPFDFVVQDTSLPAGQYTLEQVRGFLVIRNAKGAVKAGVMPLPKRRITAPEKSTLIFNRYDGRYFLAQLWVAGHQQGRELAKSAMELEVARIGGQREVAEVRGK